MGYSTPTSQATVIDDQTIASGGRYLSAAQSNSNRNHFCSLEATIDTVDLSSQNNPEIAIWFLYSRNEGTSYDEGDASSIEPECSPHAKIPIRDENDDHGPAGVSVMIDPYPFKILAKNSCGASVDLTLKINL